MVPRRGGSGVTLGSCLSAGAGSWRVRFESWRRMFKRSGRGPDLTELARADIGGGLAAGEVFTVASCGRTSSVSGGGVGGNMLRFTGGADCCLALLGRSVLTRFEAAKEIASRGLSSLPAPPAAFFFASEPANPVKALAWSDAATNRALPR